MDAARQGLAGGAAFLGGVVKVEQAAAIGADQNISAAVANRIELVVDHCPRDGWMPSGKGAAEAAALRHPGLLNDLHARQRAQQRFAGHMAAHFAARGAGRVQRHLHGTTHAGFGLRTKAQRFACEKRSTRPPGAQRPAQPATPMHRRQRVWASDAPSSPRRIRWARRSAKAARTGPAAHVQHVAPLRYSRSCRQVGRNSPAPAETPPRCPLRGSGTGHPSRLAAP